MRGWSRGRGGRCRSTGGGERWGLGRIGRWVVFVVVGKGSVAAWWGIVCFSRMGNVAVSPC